MLEEFDGPASNASGSSRPRGYKSGTRMSPHFSPTGRAYSGGRVMAPGAMPQGARQSVALESLRRQIMSMRQGQQPLMNMLNSQNAGAENTGSNPGVPSGFMQMLEQKMHGGPANASGVGMHSGQARFMQMLQDKMQNRGGMRGASAINQMVPSAAAPGPKASGPAMQGLLEGNKFGGSGVFARSNPVSPTRHGQPTQSQSNFNDLQKRLDSTLGNP
jgi:hypothetical protein